MLRRSVLCPAVLALLLPAAASGTAAAQEVEAPNRASADALQVLADLTLIDGACRRVVVNFGVGFRFAARQGLADVAVMPGGARRSEFETALRARSAAFSRDELCGEIAANYAEALPGSVTFPSPSPARP